MIDNYEAWTEDGRYGLRIPTIVLEKMLNFCENSKGMETGGVFVGHYSNNHDCALVTDCSGAPQDSKVGARYFYRGIKGLQNWFRQLWHHQERQYYLGEWHYHPMGSPTPSHIDVEQMKHNASDISYHCPEPALFIIGGDPKSGWTYESLVYIREIGEVRLFRK